MQPPPSIPPTLPIHAAHSWQPMQWVFLFHVLFYLVFLPRWLQRKKSIEAIEAGAEGATARRFPVAPLVCHALAMGVLYYGLDSAVLGLPGAGPWLFPPQRVAGAIAMLAATGLAAAALAVFRSWRLAARLDSGHQLCMVGPFRWFRHPIYLAMDLLALGSWLWAPTALVACGAVLVALGGDLRARSEEHLLLEAFGDDYRRYCAVTRRFVPGIY